MCSPVSAAPGCSFSALLGKRLAVSCGGGKGGRGSGNAVMTTSKPSSEIIVP